MATVELYRKMQGKNRKSRFNRKSGGEEALQIRLFEKQKKYRKYYRCGVWAVLLINLMYATFFCANHFLLRYDS